MASTVLKMAPNLPVAMKIRFVDVWPNDPTKDPNGKGYGSQVSVKGEVNGDRDTTIYLKGFANAAIGQLENAGVIAKDNYQHDPEAKYSIPVLNGDVSLVLDQPAGERYPKLKITPKSNGKPPVASALPAKPAPPKTVPGGEEEETGAPPADGADPKVEQRAELLAAHGRCFAHVCNKYVPYAAEKGVELSLEGVSALTAQLWIELNKRGLA